VWSGSGRSAATRTAGWLCTLATVCHTPSPGNAGPCASGAMVLGAGSPAGPAGGRAAPDAA